LSDFNRLEPEIRVESDPASYRFEMGYISTQPGSFSPENTVLPGLAARDSAQSES